MKRIVFCAVLLAACHSRTSGPTAGGRVGSGERTVRVSSFVREPADGRRPREAVVNPIGRNHADAGIVYHGRYALATDVTEYTSCPPRCVRLQGDGTCDFWANEDECAVYTLYAPDGAVGFTITQVAATAPCMKGEQSSFAESCDALAHFDQERLRWRPAETDPTWGEEDGGP